MDPRPPLRLSLDGKRVCVVDLFAALDYKSPSGSAAEVARDARVPLVREQLSQAPRYPSRPAACVSPADALRLLAAAQARAHEARKPLFAPLRARLAALFPRELGPQPSIAFAPAEDAHPAPSTPAPVAEHFDYLSDTPPASFPAAKAPAPVPTIPPLAITADDWSKALTEYAGEAPLFAAQLSASATWEPAAPGVLRLRCDDFLYDRLEDSPQFLAHLKGFLAQHWEHPVLVAAHRDAKPAQGELIRLPVSRPAPAAEQPREGFGAAHEKIITELFEGKELRFTPDGKRIAVLDVFAALGYAVPDKSYRDARSRHPEFQTLELGIVLGAAGRPTPTVDAAGLYQILSTLDTPKVAPFRRWLAEVGAAFIDGDPRFAREAVGRAEAAGRVSGAEAEMMRLRLEQASYLKEILKDSDYLPENSRRTLRVLAAEVATGRSFTALKPPAEGYLYTPTDIAGEVGASLYDVGRAISALGLKGTGREGLEGYSEPYQTHTPDRGDGKIRNVIAYRYTAAAKERIKAHLKANGGAR